MTTLQTGALTAAAAIAFSFFMKGRAAKTLTFLPGAVHSVSFDGTTPVIEFDLIIQNPSNRGFNIMGLSGNLTVNDFQVGNFTSYRQTFVRPLANTSYRLNVRLSILGIVNDLIRAIQGGGITQIMKFKAWVN